MTFWFRWVLLYPVADFIRCIYLQFLSKVSKSIIVQLLLFTFEILTVSVFLSLLSFSLKNFDNTFKLAYIGVFSFEKFSTWSTYFESRLAFLITADLWSLALTLLKSLVFVLKFESLNSDAFEFCFLWWFVDLNTLKLLISNHINYLFVCYISWRRWFNTRFFITRAFIY